MLAYAYHSKHTRNRDALHALSTMFVVQAELSTAENEPRNGVHGARYFTGGRITTALRTTQATRRTTITLDRFLGRSEIKVLER